MSQRVVIIDNYDSFTHNLCQSFAALGARVSVVRNDAIDIAGLEALAPERLVLSAGPGSPENESSVFARFVDAREAGAMFQGTMFQGTMFQRTMFPGTMFQRFGRKGTGGAGICGAAVARFRGSIPILGVCLGHQLLAESHGARLVSAHAPVHGKRWPVHHKGCGIFAGLPTPFEAARYHSLTVARSSVSAALRIVACSTAAGGKNAGSRAIW